MLKNRENPFVAPSVHLAQVIQIHPIRREFLTIVNQPVIKVWKFMTGGLLAVAVSACGLSQSTTPSAPSNAMGIEASAHSPTEKLLQERIGLTKQREQMKSNFLKVKVQASVLGALGGALLGSAVCDSDDCKIALPVLMAGLSGVGAHALTEKSKQYALLEQVLDESIQALERDLKSLHSYLATMNTQISEYELRVAELRHQIATGQASQSQLDTIKAEGQKEIAANQLLTQDLQKQIAFLERDYKRAVASGVSGQALLSFEEKMALAWELTTEVAMQGETLAITLN